MPSSGFFLRHVNNVSISDLDVTHFTPDARPLFWLEDVHGARFDNVHTRASTAEHPFAFKDVSDLSLRNALWLPDGTQATVADQLP